MIHKNSEVQSDQIGSTTRIWQYCVVMKGAVIGDNCNIGAHCFIENEVVIGNNVTIKNGVQVWNGISIDDNVFIGSNVTFTNDRYPVAGNSDNFNLEKTLVKKNAVIGAGTTLLPGITIAEYAVIGAGSVLTKNVGKQEVWYGVPAKLEAYVCLCGEKTMHKLVCEKCQEK